MRMGTFNVVQGRERAARDAYAEAISLQPQWQMMIYRYRAMGFHLLYPYPRADLEVLHDELARWDGRHAPLNLNQNHFEGTTIQAFLLGLTNWRLEEEEAVEAYVADLDRLSVAQPDDSLAYSLARTLEGLQVWRRGEPERALQFFDDARLHFPVWVTGAGFYDEPLVHYLRAEILYGEGRLEEALPWYASLDDGGVAPAALAGVFYLGPSYLRQAQIYDQLGENDTAIDFYERFIELWKDCDVELRPHVEEARERLGRLLEASSRESGDEISQ